MAGDKDAAAKAEAVAAQAHVHEKALGTREYLDATVVPLLMQGMQARPASCSPPAWLASMPSVREGERRGRRVSVTSTAAAGLHLAMCLLHRRRRLARSGPHRMPARARRQSHCRVLAGTGAGAAR